MLLSRFWIAAMGLALAACLADLLITQSFYHRYGNTRLTEAPHPGSTASRYCRADTPKRRQDSTTERIAATFGPAASLPI